MRSADLCSTNLLLVVYCLLHASNCYLGIMPVSGLTNNDTDHLALLAFKARITQDPLQVMTSWNDSIHFCQWQGVTCSHRHPLRVTALDLHSQHLSGSIPPHLGNLSFLHSLYLYENNFIHQIPQEMGKLSRLEWLALENNSFDGQIPTNISHCSKLMYLGLGGNNLIGQIPPEIGSLQNLRVLRLYMNRLTGSIPSSLGNLSSLQVLSATINFLEGSIPHTLGQLKNLTSFAIGANELSGTIPPSIYNLSSITLFSVPVNQIHGTLPHDLGINIFPKLLKLNIHTNQLTGQIPKLIANASSLESISIQNNQFSGEVPSFSGLRNLVEFLFFRNNLGNGQDHNLNFLSSLSNCTKLEVLSGAHNNFGGVLPNFLGNFSKKLITLSLGFNHIHGWIPDEIGDLTGLISLGLERNRLTGTIPSSMGRMQKLGNLYLNENKLSGAIPSSLGNLTSIIGLNLMDNNLEGNIPSSLGQCHKVLLLKLSQNKLNGTIPEEVLSILSLTLNLDLSRNHLVGPLPFEIGKLTNLGSFDVSHNKLSGDIPSSLGSCTSLTSLHMNDNLFQGTIPESLSSLRGLDHLDLSSNNLSGQIPKYFKNFASLLYLNLSYNDFEGEVPTGEVFKNVSAFSITGNNRLCGGVSQLQLPICTNNVPKKHKYNVALVVGISIVGGHIGLAALAYAIYLWSRTRKWVVPSASLLEDRFMRLSFETLLKATNGFSSAQLIGQGGFGFVYKGILGENEMVVAVKVLKLQLRGAAKSFMAECGTLRSIRHRNLVKILSVCSSIDHQGNDFKALVYEYMSNGSLEEWLHPVSRANAEAEDQPRSLSIRKRLDIAIDIASALNYLHLDSQPPIVHCDLKPSNVLMDADMTAHVNDFGLARFLQETLQGSSTSQSASIGLKGSIGYVPPEYGMGCEVSTHGDVYSYGILVLEMFTGKRPTDNMFEDGLTLGQFVQSSLPDQVTEIADPTTLLVDEEEDESRSRKIQECLVSALRVGVACCAEAPSQRMDIESVLSQLHQIRIAFIGNEIQRRH